MTERSDAKTGTWLDDVEPGALAVAQMGFERAQIAGRRDAWQVAISRLIPSQLVTVTGAERQAESRARFWKTEAEALRRKLDDRERDHLRATRDMRLVLAAVQRLADHRRKTLRMADLFKALSAERSVEVAVTAADVL